MCFPSVPESSHALYIKNLPQAYAAEGRYKTRKADISCGKQVSSTENRYQAWKADIRYGKQALQAVKLRYSAA